MAIFLPHDELRKELLRLFEEAEGFLMIVSPFIKLDQKLKRCIEKKQSDKNFHLLVLYGKNESDVSKSLGLEDLTFFKQFQNVEIRYHPDLHAKYYANENNSIVTSLNLHQFSLRNNIESGVKFERRLFGVDNRNDDKAFEYFSGVFEDSDEYYIKHIEEKRRFFGLFKGTESVKVDVDETNVIYKTNQKVKPSFESKSSDVHIGYCIRTGVRIKFNMEKPFSKEGYDSWVRFSNPDYSEGFCHFSGKPSSGQTSFNKPVLREHYSAAMQLMKKNNHRY